MTDDRDVVDADQLGADQLGTEQLGAEQLAADQLGVEHLSREHLDSSQLGAEQSTGQRFIQPLPTTVADQMAAGQVIDSLAAVVRELVENALDAQATRLTVQLWPQVGRVQVADNGVGMGEADLRLAATAHSTSKIRTPQDLWQVNSLGFRGQALHSLAQVGQLTLCSRPATAASGLQVTYGQDGNAQRIQPIAQAPGTIATLSQLFAPWPARRQGLPSPRRQLRDVQQILYAIALCHPQITWTVRLEDRPWFLLRPGPTAKTLLPQLLSSVAEADLRERVEPLDGGTLYTMIGLPDRCHRARADWVKVAVNGRMVSQPELEQGLLQAFRYTLPRHRYPLGFVHLRLPADQIDWNRSPDKSTLYLHQIEDWVAQLRASIETLLQQHPTEEPGGVGRVTQVIKSAEQAGTYGNGRRNGRSSLSSDDWGEAANDLDEEASAAGQVNLSDPWPDAALPKLTVLAQMHNRYLLAEQPDGLCLIEQHIAHERVLYERLQDQWQVVPLETPLILDYLALSQIEQLQRIGLDIEAFGPQRWAVRSAPAPLGDRADLADALVELSRGSDLDTALVATACRTAIRNGIPLSLPEMQRLASDWQRTRNPRTCPHGRPICLTLTETSLARFFRRQWVIGKSHGLE